MAIDSDNEYMFLVSLILDSSLNQGVESPVDCQKESLSQLN